MSSGGQNCPELRCLTRKFPMNTSLKLFYLFILGLSPVAPSAAALLCGAWASHCGGCSLQSTGLKACRLHRWGTQSQQLWCIGLVAPRHVGFSQTRDQTRAVQEQDWTRIFPCTVPPGKSNFLFLFFFFYLMACGILVLLPEINPHPLHWKSVLITGLQQSSQTNQNTF